MAKQNSAFLIAAVVLPALIHVAFLAISQPYYSRSMDQVDTTIFVASVASGSACLLRAAKHWDASERAVLLVLYLVAYTPNLYLFRALLCTACGWREPVLVI
jgi:hypothetical protein